MGWNTDTILLVVSFGLMALTCVTVGLLARFDKPPPPKADSRGEHAQLLAGIVTRA